MNDPRGFPIPDVQRSADTRQLAIDRVGIKSIRHPVRIGDKSGGVQHTIAMFNMYVQLPHNFKGTHMSRFVEILNSHEREISVESFETILREMVDRLEAEAGRVEMSFPYFINKAAPVSGVQSLLDYDVMFAGSIENGRYSFTMKVQVPVTSLCPCSKEISEYGAHNQRGLLSIDVRTTRGEGGRPHLVWIEELINVAESSASAPVYPLLKRPDERHVTMQAYDNPVFVEDMVRNASVQLREDPRIAWFRVHAINHESIHNHGAFASVEWSRDPR